MANIEITALPSKGSLNNNDYFHIKDGSDSGDYKVLPSVVKNKVLELAVGDSPQFTNLILTGDLQVQGTTTTVDTDNLLVNDPLIVLGSNNATDSLDLGLIGVRSSSNIALIWDESEDEFAFIETGDDGSTSGDILISNYTNVRVNNLTATLATLSNLSISGNIVVGGTVDGRDISADGLALDTLYVKGISEYNSLTEYQYGSLVTKDGAILSSTSNTNTGNDLTDTSFWLHEGVTSSQSFSDLETLSPTVEGQVFSCIERNNSKYILQASGYTPLAGDLTFANGRVARLQVGDVFDAGHFGLLESNNATQNSTALNDMFSRVRVITSVSENSVSLKIPQGVYTVGEIDATEVRSNGWVLEGSGSVLECATAGATVLNLLSGRKGTLRNITIRGDTSTPPRIGFAIGYGQGATSSSEFIFENCYTEGNFSLTSFYNGGSEETTLIGGQLENSDSSSDSYCYIADGFNYFGRRSIGLEGNPVYDQIAKPITDITGQVVTTSVDHGLQVGDKVRGWDITGGNDFDAEDAIYTVVSVPSSTTFEVTGLNGTSASDGYASQVIASSFVQTSLINVSMFKSGGGKVMWFSSNCKRHDNRCYPYSLDDNAIRIYYNNLISQTVPQAMVFDIGSEGSDLKHVFELYEGNQTSLEYNMGGWRIYEHGTQADDTYFGTNSLAATFSFTGCEIFIADFAGTSKDLVDDPSRYEMIGRISTRNSAGMSGFPSVFSGTFETRDPQTSTLGAGSFFCPSTELNGTSTQLLPLKGGMRVFGDKSSTSSSPATEDFGVVERQGVSGFGHFTGDDFRTIADDGFFGYPIPGDSGTGAIVAVNSNTGSGPQGLYWVRKSSQAIQSLGTGTTPPTLNTGIPTGTTGTDGTFNLFVSDSADTFYIENRSGGPVSFSVTFLSAL